MNCRTRSAAVSLALLFCLASVVWAQAVGGVRGVVEDKDFGGPLRDVRVQILETDATTTTGEDGQFVFSEVEPGTYTLVFSREGFTRQVVSDVVVSAGRLTEVSASLAGEFVEMEEFVVQDLELGGGSELGTLQLQLTAPSIMNALSSEVMSEAGVSNAADALRLVPGTTVQDGKYAVVRGLPDRYVNSQLNSVRLPTADVDKRAVQLDQFPAALVENIQVTKAFTPDQQGDASGGAVNVVLKGIPDERVLEASIGTEYNTQVRFRDDFLTYDGGDVSAFGLDDGGRDIPDDGGFGGTMGVSPDDAPFQYNGTFTAGGSRELENGIRVGGLASLYYKREASYYEDGRNDRYLARLGNDGYEMAPFVNEGTTRLYDVTQGVDAVRWGALGAVGAELEDHSFGLLYMRTQVTEDEATLLEDTRGSVIFADDDDVDAPFLRNETLEYTERAQSTIQLKGEHTFDLTERTFPGLRIGGELRPEIDWTLAHSVAQMDQPDKRVFSTEWVPGSTLTFGGTTIEIPPVHRGDDPSGSGFGFAQRIWKDIEETSNQLSLNGLLPFSQWDDEEGYFKSGLFVDRVEREYNEDTFAYPPGGTYEAPWEQFWSNVYLDEEIAGDSWDPTISASDQNVDYSGEQDINAGYLMADVPLTSFLKVIGGFRYETTDLSIINHPESGNAQYLPPGGTGWTRFGPEADVEFSQEDFLPAVSFEVVPIEQVRVRASYTETVARQTFKELSPVMQMEFLGADIFVGNPLLQMSALKNYDLRIDYEPYPGGLLSASWFYKDIERPIEIVQRFQASLFYTTPVNYPEGQLSGYELEARQNLGQFWERLDEFSAGANATFIDAEVTLPQDEQAAFAAAGIPITTRDMTNAPEYLYNLNVTYESEDYGTRVGLFYTVRGDTLVEGGLAFGRVIPDVYLTEYGTLNLSIMQPLSENTRVSFKAKNLTDPEIQEVYRAGYVDGDTVKTSYSRGIDFTVSVDHQF